MKASGVKRDLKVVWYVVATKRAAYVNTSDESSGFEIYQVDREYICTIHSRAAWDGNGRTVWTARANRAYHFGSKSLAESAAILAVVERPELIGCIAVLHKTVKGDTNGERRI